MEELDSSNASLKNLKMKTKIDFQIEIYLFAFGIYLSKKVDKNRCRSIVELFHLLFTAEALL